jgi:uncharacterized protein YjeT (DUF2065 family)
MIKVFLNTIAILFLLESLILLLFPRKIKHILKQILRNKNILKKIAILELILGLILFLIAVVI